MRAIRLVSEADEETKDKLRNGELSINGAIKALEKRKFVEIIPGHTVGQILTPEMMGINVHQMMSPFVTYGVMPADDRKERSARRRQDF